MAKIKVHELAKELGKESKDVIAYLESNGIEAKAQSGIEDDVAEKVRKHFTKKQRPVDKDGNPIKKKKNVFVVTRGSDDRKRRSGSGNEGARNDKSNSKDNRDKKNQQAAAPRGPIRPRTFSDGLRPSQRASAQSTDTEFVSKKKPVEAEANNKPEKKNDRPERNERQEKNDRPRNERGQQGNRSEKNDNNKRDNRDNNRNDRNDRGQGKGDRNSSRNNRPSQAAPAADVAPANSGKGGRRDDKKKKNNRDNNNLGGKKQENFINLEKNGGKKKKNNTPKAPERDMNEVLTITIADRITIKDLADKMKVQPSAVVKTLFMKGKMVTVNQEVDFEEASEIALEFNCICEEEEKVDVIAELLKEEEEDTSNFPSRPPVVCVMGHVDHGKTSLLDAIRDTKVTDREAGGITQHIGAYTVSINGQDITFLDTPGHEAFTAMRMRGANSTDIAILVVAADDGVMPQTVEAINHAKAAGIEIIVAINKIDKPNANIDRVKQELSEYQLIPEDWGGSTVFCPVSAHTKEGIDNLLEMILLTAEVLELKANPKRKARGLVIEAQLDKGRGAVATVLVQKGTLHVGDPVACGSCHGKVRAMIDDTGARVKTAGPSVPVEILGLSEVPNAGEVFMAFDSEKEAHAFADTFVAEHKNRLVEQTKSKMSLDALFSEIESGNLKELDIIVKADVQGSVEAVKQSLEKLSNEEVVVKTIHGGVGTINESDVVLASASNAIIIGFNVRIDPQAKATADREGVDLRLYKVIYDAINDVEAAMKGMLDPVYEEKVIGHAEVRQIFKASGVGNIAGSYVTDGYFERDCMVRVNRDGEQIFEGKLASLKRFKDDVKEVKSNFECGLVIEDFNDVQEMDIIEAYKMVEVPR
ncbi:MAG: translation initiation factor IF-2 [Pseudobutyrivibrio sp.]|uniref:translation initiation factor IF-2 n=1 Tax=Pseudobutyrivibrio sp. TaxID=2014367 RepID=UPI0025CFD7B4|nr:translation initiation factor IF-2 [Pseudobutyrivibrio sp.]MBQ8489477.1 translation initiation factor IF-2 [Pseudobutyrivibrio sp.]